MRAFRAPIVETHELTYFILLALIAIHIASAVIAELKEGGTLISAMFTGRKIHGREPVDAREAVRAERHR
jgi:cytochrome b